jgi:hypothetical protein
MGKILAIICFGQARLKVSKNLMNKDADYLFQDNLKIKEFPETFHINGFSKHPFKSIKYYQNFCVKPIFLSKILTELVYCTIDIWRNSVG